MSGITGIYFLDGRPVGESLTTAMVRSIAHRGPDGRNSWRNGSLGLGHAALHTTPGSESEHLPRLDFRTGCVITCDSRIDNRDELIRELHLAPARKGGAITDAEIILRSYERWQLNAPAKLIGDFAFAIWDPRERRLFCARDHFGVKPFYYAKYGSILAFGSEIKAVLSVPEVPRRINELRIGEFFANELHDQVDTFYLDVFRLPPAHRLIATSAGLSVDRYWSLDQDSEIVRGSDREYAEEFRRLFANAVRRRIHGEKPVGTMLSGGLDSTSIACTAKSLSGLGESRPLHSFSILFDTIPKCNEREYIQHALAGGGFTSHLLEGGVMNPLAPQLNGPDQHFEDEPLPAPNLSLSWHSYQHAAHVGVPVILDGFDGDTTVSHGIGRLSELAHARRWIRLASEAAAYTDRVGGSFRTVYVYYVRSILAAAIRSRLRTAQSSSAKRRGFSTLPERYDSLNPQFIRRIGLREKIRSLHEGRRGLPLTERQEHHKRMTWGALVYTLEQIDRASAMFGIEIRFPFFDKDLVEYATSLPADQKLRNGWTRYVLRQSMAGILPEEVRWRPGKANLSPYLDHSLFAMEGERIRTAVYDRAVLLQQYLNTDYLQSAFERLAQRHSDPDGSHALLKTFALSKWLDPRAGS